MLCPLRSFVWGLLCLAASLAALAAVKAGAHASAAEAEGKGRGPELVAPSSPKGTTLRLRETVANIPTPLRADPHETIPRLGETFDSGTGRPRSLSSPAFPPDNDVDDAWQEPETLLESLRELCATGATSKWATEVVREIQALKTTVAEGSAGSDAILQRLAELRRQVLPLAERISDQQLARQFRKVDYALGRRLDVWQGVLQLRAPRPPDGPAPERDSQKLALCLAEIESLTDGSAEGEAWRRYLLIDALKRSSAEASAEGTGKASSTLQDEATRRLAQQVLARLTETPLTPRQQQFVANGPVSALREQLRYLAAEPIGAKVLLRDIESYEHSALPSDARRLAMDCLNLSHVAAQNRRQLAQRVDLHYRNANVRIAVTVDLINKLIPEQSLEYALVDDRVLGRPTWGESVMAAELAVRMVPDPNRVRMVLEVTGEITAATTSDAGPARFHNESESRYIVRKPLEIDMRRIDLREEAEVGVENQSRLTGVETPLDRVPLVSSLLRGVAKSQMEQSKAAADREVKQKVAAKARQRVEDEVHQHLSEVVTNLNQRVFEPLNSLSLDPQMIDADTTEKRFAMRLRLAGEDQLGSHTPRPAAPIDSLASLQIHESALNNGIERLQLNGRTVTLPQLSEHVAARLGRPTAWQIDPDQANVKITFAEKDAVRVRCQDGCIKLTLSIIQLRKGSRKWPNFQIMATYKPKINGRSAELARDGIILLDGLNGPRPGLGAQIALRGIFSHALSSNNSWELVPKGIVNAPKLSDASITQFQIGEGWIGVALGPKRPAVLTARQPRLGLW